METNDFASVDFTICSSQAVYRLEVPATKFTAVPRQY